MAGFYKTVKFEFSDTTLKMFAYDLNTWVKAATEMERSEMKNCQLLFTVPAEIIKHVSPEVVRNFEQSFPQDYFTLEGFLKDNEK